MLSYSNHLLSSVLHDARQKYLVKECLRRNEQVTYSPVNCSRHSQIGRQKRHEIRICSTSLHEPSRDLTATEQPPVSETGLHAGDIHFLFFSSGL